MNINNSIIIIFVYSIILGAYAGLTDLKWDKVVLIEGSLTILVLFIAQLVKTYLRRSKVQKNKNKNKDDSWVNGDIYKFLGKDLIDLYFDTYKLISDDYIKKTKFSDYSFVLFPLAKSYEGFLKKILVELKIITNDSLKNDPGIAINKYFSPDNKLIFDYLKDRKRDKTVPPIIYSIYQECRNNILHYDPVRDYRIKSTDDLRFYIERIEDAMHRAYKAFIKKKS